ncbi:MAG: S9 family peptidase [Chlamydiae bacterium]|nr:S9 family peptidase [Chlamydiota bacterium]
MPIFATPYGSFSSPISAELVAKGSVAIRQILIDEDHLFWIEGRPEENGRAVAVCYESKKDILPSPYYIRTTVHEYGGKCSEIFDGIIYFSNFTDQNLYKLLPDKTVVKITNTTVFRFADFSIHPNGKWLYCVLEDHTEKDRIENCIGRVDLETGEVEKIAKGHDFYAAPRLSPDGKKIAFIFWDHPNMAWDATELWIADLGTTGYIESEKKIAGSKDESVVEPSFSPEGLLYFISDRSGYWNLYNEENEAIYEMNAEFSNPIWLLGNKSYTFVKVENKTKIAAIITEKAIDSLALIDIEKHTLKKIPLEFNTISDISTWKENIVIIAKSPTKLQHIIQVDPISEKISILKAPKELEIDSSYFSTPEIIEFPSLNDKTAFAFFYPPKNPKVRAKNSEKPPLIVFTHGGPTSNVNSSLKLAIQFWTSRGFAVCDVNYSGSSGFGREYRDRLKGNWGVVDVFDVCSAAKFLVNKGAVDKDKLIIEGGSAGGYTTLAALTFTDVFKVGGSYFGVSDLELLTQDGHKYEARYLDSLIGPYPAKKSLYQERSPLFHADKLSCPVLFLQGGMDKIVPKNQAEKMYEALLKKKIPTAYILFEEEAHGFRSSQNIITAFESELYFYRKILKIPSNEKAPPIKIVGLDS